MKVGNALIEAALKQAEGELAVHRANIKVYQTMPAGIGEHSDVTEAIIAGDVTSVTNVIPSAGDFVTIMWNPTSAGNKVGGAAIEIESI